MRPLRVLSAAAAGAAGLALAADAPHAQLRQAVAEAQTDLVAEAPDDNFGWSAAVAGDVNGDGVADLVVGAVYNDAAAKDAGKAYVFLGGPTVGPSPFVTMTGARANDQFAVSVAGAGDVNGDGYADIVVGARLDDLGGNASGAAYIYLGGAAMDGVADLAIPGESANDWFGNSVAGAGDVNGDGFDDVVAGAPYSDRAGSAAGAAFVYFGGAAMDAAADVVLAGEVHDDQFGWSVNGAGDVDGDGFEDVIVGARLHCVDLILCAGAAYARGRAYVFRGGPAMDAVADVVLDGAAANDWFGNTVAGVGDVNGDGRGDVAVGAIYADPVVGGSPLSAAGTTSIFLGGAPMDAFPDAVLPGEGADDQSGWAVSAAGDVNGDGAGDLWTTAHFFDDGANSGAGKAYLFAGGDLIGLPPLASAVGEGIDVQLGQSVAGGDVAGAGGFLEGLVGQVYSRDAGPGSGKALVLSPFCLDLGIDAIGLTWSSCFPFDGFNVYRGTVDGLGAGPGLACMQAGIAGTTASHAADVPPPGTARLYLVSGRTSVLEGALGFDSSGERRPNPAPCP
jgi:hypothetical protein